MRRKGRKGGKEREWRGGKEEKRERKKRGKLDTRDRNRNLQDRVDEIKWNQVVRKLVCL